MANAHKKSTGARAAKLVGFVTFIGMVLAASGGASLYIYRTELLGFARAPFRKDAVPGTTVEIPKGANLNTIAATLMERGVVSDATMFYRYVRYVVKKDGALKAGTYTLSPNMPPDDIIAVLEAGKQQEQRFTIPEGLRKEAIAELIAAAGFSNKDELLRVMNDPATVTAFGVPSKGAGGQDSVPGGVEGYLFPDTYQFPVGADATFIVKRMRARLDEVIDDRLKARMKELGMDLHQTLTLAAIVEKETGQPEERPRIAAVFHNRMKQGMKLQTDPTVIYGIANYDGNIRKDDLQTPHPYNTYVITGLPPGPIAQPGKAAITAALFPLPTDELFFVAKGNSGTHEFCATLDCHNRAVAKWQIEFNKNKRGP